MLCYVVCTCVHGLKCNCQQISCVSMWLLGSGSRDARIIIIIIIIRITSIISIGSSVVLSVFIVAIVIVVEIQNYCC